MKKIVIFVLAALLLMGAVACNVGVGGENDADVPDTLAGKLFITFRDALKAGTTSPEELAKIVSASEELGPVSTITMPVEEGFLSGFDSEITGFKEGAMFGPEINPNPFIGYILVPADGTSADDLAKTLEENANLNWNICVSADDMLVKVVDGIVFFVMCPLEIAK